jgi:hypothetical protein
MPEPSWLHFHNHRISNYDGDVVKSIPQLSVVAGSVKLFRYLGEYPRFPIDENRRWTEIETDSPEIASGSTGIPIMCAKFRIEWTFPVGLADQIVRAGHRRMCRGFPSAIEYKNRRPVTESECTFLEL